MLVGVSGRLQCANTFLRFSRNSLCNVPLRAENTANIALHTSRHSPIWILHCQVPDWLPMAQEARITSVSGKKKAEEDLRASGPSIGGDEAKVASIAHELDLERARKWSLSAGVFSANDLADALDLSRNRACDIAAWLLHGKAIQLVAPGPEGDPKGETYRAQLTSPSDSGEAGIVETGNDGRLLYHEIALDETAGPGDSRDLYRAFLLIGAKARADRTKLQAQLQTQLDEMHSGFVAGTGHLGSLEANREFATALNSLLDDLGLRLKDPKSGLPATLRVMKPARGPETGYFSFNVGSTSHGSYDRLPKLVLVERPENTRRSRS